MKHINIMCTLDVLGAFNKQKPNLNVSKIGVAALRNALFGLFNS